MSDKTNMASAEDTMERCQLSARDWDRLDTPIKLLLREAVKLVQVPPLSGVYYVTASNDGGEETKTFVAANSFSDAINKFCDWCGIPAEDWYEEPRTYYVENKPVDNECSIIHWQSLNSQSASGLRSGPHARR